MPPAAQRGLRAFILGLGLASTNVAIAEVGPPYDAYWDYPAVRVLPTASLDPLPGGSASSRDPQRDVPNLLWTFGAAPALDTLVARTPEAAARWYMGQYAPWYGVSQALVDSAEVLRTIDLGRGGIVVIFGQRLDGIELFAVRQKVLLNRNLELIALSGSLHPGAPEAPFARDAGNAIAGAIADLLGKPVSSTPLRLLDVDSAGFERHVLADGAVVDYRFQAPVRAKRVWFRTPTTLLAAWWVEVQLGYGPNDDAASFVVADSNARLLYRADLQANHQFRVWADPTGDKRPQSSPLSDFSPHPTGTSDGSTPLLTQSVMVDIAPFNSTPNGVGDPWLTDGLESLGNHVDAFADLNPPGGFNNGDWRATGTPPGNFDHDYDFGLSPLASYEQTEAGTVQAFYVANWLHDWYYDSGMNETAGVAQHSNYGRGGAEGDRMEIRTSNYAFYDNAVANIPADGASPVMYIGLTHSREGSSVTTTSGFDAGQTEMHFGGPATFDVTADAVLAQDGTAPFNDACEPLEGDFAGRIVLVDRGKCIFLVKNQNAKAAGAAGVVIMNHTPGKPAPPLIGGVPSDILPQLSVTYEAGQLLREELLTGPLTVSLRRFTQPDRNMALSSELVAHEYGHYLHLRQVYSRTPTILSISEGWGDFVALHLQLREGDDLDGTFAIDAFGSGNDTSGDPAYYGVRRYPYSTNMSKNPLTLKHIQDSATLPPNVLAWYNSLRMSEVHNAGEVWGATLWESYVALQKDAAVTGRRSFDEMRRVMSDYVISAMAFTPEGATWLDARDALILVAMASDMSDGALIASAFAKRGAGSCAVTPSARSTSFEGVVESYEVSARLSSFVQGVFLDGISCDGNDTLDAGETGYIGAILVNSSVVPLEGASLTVSTTAVGINFPDGTTIPIPTLAPGAQITLTMPIALASTFTPSFVEFTFSVEGGTSCPSGNEWPLYAVLGGAPGVGVSHHDTVQINTGRWNSTGSVGSFSLVVGESGPMFHGQNEEYSDAIALISPEIAVGDGPFTFGFSHSYAFDTYVDETGTPYFFDGGVVEVTRDGGATWTDVADLGDPGYSGVLYANSDNPLAGRPAYTGVSPSWPNFDSAEIDFGTALAGETVHFRFVLGTDWGYYAPGWSIDDMKVTGAATPPFDGLVPSVPNSIYLDGDGDGVGAGEPVALCPVPPNGVAEGGDCDDVHGDTYPGAPERCDAMDNDCDGETDEELGLGDTCANGEFGTCVVPGKQVCGDDGSVVCDAVPNTPVAEACDGLDNDCDQETDEGFGLGELCVVGLGECATTGLTICAEDGEKTCSVLPGEAQVEACNGLDDDCDGEIDEDLGLGATCSVGVGACSRTGTQVCGGGGAIACSVAPGAPSDESCNDIDDDCDGQTDEAASDGLVTFADEDGDGFGTGAAIVSCDAVAETSATNGDCDDSDADTFPGAPEAAGDLVDRNCDSKLTPPDPTDGSDAIDAADSTDSTDSTDGADAIDATDGDVAGDGTDASAGADGEGVDTGSASGCSTSTSTPNASPLVWLLPLLAVAGRRWRRGRQARSPFAIN